MIRFLAREITDPPVVPLAWLFVLIFANAALLFFSWRGRRHQAVAVAIVVANLTNVLISIGWNYFLHTWTIPPGEHPRVLAWNPDLRLPGIALYTSLVTSSILFGTTGILVQSWGKRRESISSLTADLLPVLAALLIAALTLRIPFVVQAAINRLP